MSVLLLRYLPYIAAVLVVFGAGTYTGWHANPWHGRFQSLQTADAIARAQGEEAVRKALQDQLAQAEAISQNNAGVIEKLNHENAQTAADRDITLSRVHRLEQLLAAAATRPAKGSGLPQTQGGPGATAAGGDAGPTEIERLLIDARDEAVRNASRLNALVAEITPQVETTP